MRIETSPTSRRHVVLGGGLGLLTALLVACSTYGRKPAEEPAAAPDGGTPGEPLAKAADVPVGSGIIVGDTVVTQPSAGTFTGLSSTCTHAGCTVSEVVGAEIVCPCHGSRFRLDGSVARGPASRALESRAVTVKGGEVFAG